MPHNPTVATVIYCYGSFGTGSLLLLHLRAALIEGYVAEPSHNALCHYIINDGAITMLNSPAALEASVCSTWRKKKKDIPLTAYIRAQIYP